MSFSDFIDERMLVSKNVLGTKEMKIKVLPIILLYSTNSALFHNSPQFWIGISGINSSFFM